MKKITRIILVVLVFASALTACHKPGSKQAKYIPKDAYFVFGINSRSILEKVGKANIGIDSLAKILSDGKDSASLDDITKFKEFQNAGFDLDQETFMFMKSGGSIMSGSSFSFGVVGALKDTAAFVKFVKKQAPELVIKKGEGYSYASIEGGFTAGWNNEAIIIVFTSGYGTSPESFTFGDTSSQRVMANLFALKESESVGSVAGFNDVLNENTDMMFFANSALNQGSMSFLNMTKMADLLKDSYATGTANFEDGKVAATFTSHYNSEMVGLLNKYPGRAIDMDMLNKYPSPVNGFMSISFDPQLIGAVLKFAGMDALANQTLQQFGLNFTLDDFTKAFKGDLAIIVSDLGIQQKEISAYGDVKLPKPVVNKEPVFKLVFNATIASKPNYDKIVTSLASKDIMVLQNGQYVFPHMGDYAMKVTDKNFYVASNAGLLQQYEAGVAGKANIPADVQDKIKGKGAAFYFDINKVLQMIPVDSSEQPAMDTAKAVFKDVIILGENFDGKVSKGTAELRLLNEKENSLVTIIRLILSEAKMEKERPMNNMGGMVDTDSTAMMIPPPPPPQKPKN